MTTHIIHGDVRMSSNSTAEDEDTRTSLQSPWRPHLVRNLILVAFVFTTFSVYRSHHSMNKHFSQLTQNMAEYQDLSFLFPANNTDHVSDTKKNKIAIPYAISLTSCDVATTNLDGAAVLRHSIKRFDVSSKYDSKFLAFIHPNATSCSSMIEKMGYEVHLKPTPINVTDIRGSLKKFIHGASCCGPAEFLKLYSYTLTQYPVAVHLDLDVILLKPLDDLFDSMIEGHSSPARRRLPAMWIHNVSQLPEQIDAYFTRDYNMLSFAGYRKPIETSMQGGFLVVRPNMTVFDEYIDIILEGKYDAGYGWGAPELRFGGTYGSAQIQGIVSYFYGHVHPGTAVELNRCIVNTMVDRPTDKKGKCLSPQADGYCEDCRQTNISDVVSTHFTVCQKPWWCPDGGTQRLCTNIIHEWFLLRWEVEVNNSSIYSSTAVRPKIKDKPWVVNGGNSSFCGPQGYIKLKMRL